MKSSDPTLLAFLASTKNFISPHLLAITMPGGLVVRYCDAQEAITWGGQTYQPLNFTIEGRKQSLGLSVDVAEVVISPRVTDTISDVPLSAVAAGNGFFGAEAVIYRLYAVDWDTLRLSGPVGAITLHGGRCGETPQGAVTEFTLRIASWTELLDTSAYVENYSPNCRNTLFDNKCGVSKAAFAQTGACVSGSTTARLVTNIAQAAGFYSRGFVIMTSGAANGQRRTIRGHDAGGILHLLPGLTVAPLATDTFTVYPGCGRTMADCTRYNNIARFRGEPFIPAPETAV